MPVGGEAHFVLYFSKCGISGVGVCEIGEGADGQGMLLFVVFSGVLWYRYTSANCNQTLGIY